MDARIVEQAVRSALSMPPSIFVGIEKLSAATIARAQVGHYVNFYYRFMGWEERLHGVVVGEFRVADGDLIFIRPYEGSTFGWNIVPVWCTRSGAGSGVVTLWKKGESPNDFGTRPTYDGCQF